MPELSVVVPVYRVEPYLRKCVDSILRQDCSDLEVILVDDGSPDGCPGICDEYAKLDPRVRVIHQPNQGSVKARRAGLLAAAGEYISFMDGDDCLEGEMYAPMLALAREHGADLVVSGYLQGAEGTCARKENAIESGVYRGAKLRELKDRALCSGRYYEPGIIAALWNKVIKRKLLLSLGDLVPAEVRMGDDAAVTYPLILAASCVVVQNEIKAYFYRETGGSMSRTPDERYFDRLYALIAHLEERFKADASMLRQLDYYRLFVLEVGFGTLIGARKKPLKVRRMIGEQIRRFNLPKRLERLDEESMGKRAMARARMLMRNRPGGYMLLWIKDAITGELGS